MVAIVARALSLSSFSTSLSLSLSLCLSNTHTQLSLPHTHAHTRAPSLVVARKRRRRGSGRGQRAELARDQRPAAVGPRGQRRGGARRRQGRARGRGGRCAGAGAGSRGRGRGRGRQWLARVTARRCTAARGQVVTVKRDGQFLPFPTTFVGLAFFRAAPPPPRPCAAPGGRVGCGSVCRCPGHVHARLSSGTRRREGGVCRAGESSQVSSRAAPVRDWAGSDRPRVAWRRVWCGWRPIFGAAQSAVRVRRHRWGRRGRK